MTKTTNRMRKGGAGSGPLLPFVACLALAAALLPAPAGAADKVMTRVEGSVTMRRVVRDDLGRIIGSQGVVAEKGTLNIAGRRVAVKNGSYAVELPPGFYPWFAETTEKVKPKRSKEIIERYWAIGAAIELRPDGPATVTNDFELVLVEDSQAFCRGCHPDVRTRFGQVQSCHHSSGKRLKEVYKKPFAKSGLQLENDLMVCTTCHATHIPTAYPKYLHRSMEKNVLCLQCHV